MYFLWGLWGVGGGGLACTTKTKLNMPSESKSMILTSRSLSGKPVALCINLDQNLTTVQVSKESIHELRSYGSLKNFNLNIQRRHKNILSL